jgi:putative phosphoesterase
MKIMVFSDTHGNKKAALNILKIIDEKKPDALVHLGDGVGDAKIIEKRTDVPVYIVSGNCDMPFSAPELLTIELCGLSFMLCHGHKYRVKSGLGALEQAAGQLCCEIALFGHTHTPLVQQRENVLLINPGAAGGFPGSYGLISIKDARLVSAEIFPLSPS